MAETMTEKHDGVYVVNETVRADGDPSDTDLAKRTKDGEIVLIPRPSDSPNDPLNWSWWKKHAVFLALLPGCFLTDWQITYGSTLFEAQAMQWHMSVPAVADSISGAIFMQGPGGLLAVPLCQRYGRFPVLFWSQFLSLIFTIAATNCTNYASFTAMRTLMGFVGAAPQVIGLSIIHDMFFFHERARKINIWAFCFLVGPYLGPFCSAFIVEKLSWVNTFWVLVGFYAFSVLGVALFFDETLYDRLNPKPSTTTTGVGRRVKLMLGISGLQETAGRPGLLTTIGHQGALLIRPYLLLPTFGFVTFITMWTIGIVSTSTQLVKPPPYLFSDTAVALLYFAPMIGTVIAEFFGHWFNDFLANTYIRTHNGRFVPEHRLWGVYPSWIIGIAGLVLVGQALQKDLPWIAFAIGWAMQCFATLGTSVAISAYVLDVFPQHAALASAWICAFRTLGGFCVVYFQVKWIARDGPAVTFGSQAGISAAVIISIIAVQVFGGRWRKRFPVPAAKN